MRKLTAGVIALEPGCPQLAGSGETPDGENYKNVIHETDCCSGHLSMPALPLESIAVSNFNQERFSMNKLIMSAVILAGVFGATLASASGKV